MNYKEIANRLKGIEEEAKKELATWKKESDSNEIFDKLFLIECANGYINLLKDTGKDKKYSCIERVADTIKEFLIGEGGYNNGYYTFVSGEVNTRLEGSLDWNTPVAKAELTPEGFKRRGKNLYNSIQSILKEYDLDEILITYKDVGFGAMETQIVFKDETKGRVNLY